MLIVESEGPVLRLTLNRPEVRNAFNEELIAALSEAISGVSLETRAIIIGGAGKAFCAGGDLQWMAKAAHYTEQENFEDALKLANLFEAMASSHAVILSKVHGAAFGGGCGLVAASDIAIADEHSLFAFSEVRIGLVPATISPFVIGKIGQGHARALFSTGEAIGPDHALRIGLVHEVTTAQNLDFAIERKLKLILAAGPQAIATSKKLAQSPPLSAVDAARLLAKVRAGVEGREGVAAFLEKRDPAFKVVR